MKVYKTSESVRNRARERAEQNRRKAGVPKKKSFHERFWGRVEPITESGCMIWMGHVGHAGYGHIGINHKVKRAHRVAWEEVNGPIPEGMHLCHRCDVPCCVNPDHMFIGTHSDNMADMYKKGRSAFGEKHGNSKVTESQVIEILSDSRKYNDICADYGITLGTLSAIKNRKTWKHVNPSATADEIAAMADVMPAEAV